MIERTPCANGSTVWCDIEQIITAFGAHAMRVTAEGHIQLLLASPDATDWVDIDDAPLVQPAGKPSRARRQ